MTYDYIGAIIEFESGGLNEDQVVELIQYLHTTGIGYALQGLYGRLCQAFLEEGRIK